MISLSGCRGRNVLFISAGKSGFDQSIQANTTYAVCVLPLQCQENKRVRKIESIYPH